jgi:pyridoxine 4-dehydrogenase
MHEDVLVYCERNNIAFIPFWPLHGAALVQSARMAKIVERENAAPAQVAIAWLLKKFASIIAIPGTSSIAHLKQNVAACALRVSCADMDILEHFMAPHSC